jgi:hypothetical protein
MTRVEAKRILELCRPSDRQSAEPEIQQAFTVLRDDAELREWYEQHLQTEEAIRQRFRAIPVPAQLKQRVLEQNKIVRPQFVWGTRQWLQMAACLAVLIGAIAALTYHNFNSRAPSFAQFESRMVRSALREYKMEILTKDMTELRDWMQARQAPADFAIPKTLAHLQLTGGGVLHWQNHPVSMACFDRGDKQMLFLFVMDKNALEDPPSNTPQLDKVKRLATAAWSANGKTYLLAGPGDKDSLRKYLGPTQTF